MSSLDLPAAEHEAITEDIEIHLINRSDEEAVDDDDDFNDDDDDFNDDDDDDYDVLVDHLVDENITEQPYTEDEEEVASAPDEDKKKTVIPPSTPTTTTTASNQGRLPQFCKVHEPGTHGEYLLIPSL